MTNITEDYVSFEIAKLLKEKGFEENTPVNYFVGDDKPRGCAIGEMIFHNRAEEDKHLIACPTLQMAMKWLREVHELAINIEFQIDSPTWKWRIYHIEPSEDKHTNFQHYNTYEETCEAAIKYCLKNLI